MAPDAAANIGNGSQLRDYKIDRLEQRVNIMEQDMIDEHNDLAGIRQDLAVFQTEMTTRFNSLTSLLRWGLGVLTAVVTALTIATAIKAAGI